MNDFRGVFAKSNDLGGGGGGGGGGGAGLAGIVGGRGVVGGGWLRCSVPQCGETKHRTLETRVKGFNVNFFLLISAGNDSHQGKTKINLAGSKGILINSGNEFLTKKCLRHCVCKGIS